MHAEKFSKGRLMSAVVEARAHVAALSAAFPCGTPFKVWGPRLARDLGVSARRVRALVYGEARSIESSEMDRLRSAVARQAARESHAREQVAAIRAIVSGAVTRLETGRPDDRRLAADLLRDALGRVGTSDCAVAEPAAVGGRQQSPSTGER